MTDIGTKNAPKVASKPLAVAEDFVFPEPEPLYVDSFEPAVQNPSWLDDYYAGVAEELAAALSPKPQPAAAQPGSVAGKVETSLPPPERQMKQAILKVVNDNLTIGIERNVTVFARLKSVVRTWLQVPVLRHVTQGGKAGGRAVTYVAKAIAHGVVNTPGAVIDAAKKVAGSAAS